MPGCREDPAQAGTVASAYAPRVDDMAARVRYRLIDRERWVLSPPWADECLAYDRQGADTLVISPLAREILDRLRHDDLPSSAADLVRLLEPGTSSADAADFDAAVETTLLEFVRLGLAERTNS